MLLSCGVRLCGAGIVVLWVVLLCCDIGSSAPLYVLHTVHQLPISDIRLCKKSCLMLLSLINVVPPITEQWRF